QILFAIVPQKLSCLTSFFYTCQKRTAAKPKEGERDTRYFFRKGDGVDAENDKACSPKKHGKKGCAKIAFSLKKRRDHRNEQTAHRKLIALDQQVNNIVEI